MNVIYAKYLNGDDFNQFDEGPIDQPKMLQWLKQAETEQSPTSIDDINDEFGEDHYSLLIKPKENDWDNHIEITNFPYGYATGRIYHAETPWTTFSLINNQAQNATAYPTPKMALQKGLLLAHQLYGEK